MHRSFSSSWRAKNYGLKVEYWNNGFLSFKVSEKIQWFLLLWHTKNFAKTGCSVAKLKARSEASRQGSKFKRF